MPLCQVKKGQISFSSEVKKREFITLNQFAKDSLTFLSDQQTHQVRLLLGQNFIELLEIDDTSPSEEFEKFVIAVSRLQTKAVLVSRLSNR